MHANHVVGGLEAAGGDVSLEKVRNETVSLDVCVLGAQGHSEPGNWVVWLTLYWT